MSEPVPTEEQIRAILADGGWEEGAEGWLKANFHMPPQTMLNAAKWEAFLLEEVF